MQISSSSLHFVVPSMFRPKKHFFVAPSICIPKKGGSLLAHPRPRKSTKQLFRDVFHTFSTSAGLFGVGQSLRIKSIFCLSVCPVSDVFFVHVYVCVLVTLYASVDLSVCLSVCTVSAVFFMHVYVYVLVSVHINLSVCLSVCLYGLNCFLQARVCLCAGHSFSIFLSVCL